MNQHSIYLLAQEVYERRLFFPPEVRPMGYIDERVPAMSVYESISLMLLFGTFLLALLTTRDLVYKK